MSADCWFSYCDSIYFLVGFSQLNNASSWIQFCCNYLKGNRINLRNVAIIFSCYRGDLIPGLENSFWGLYEKNVTDAINWNFEQLFVSSSLQELFNERNIFWHHLWMPLEIVVQLDHHFVFIFISWYFIARSRFPMHLVQF